MAILGSVCEHVAGISPYVPGKPITEVARELGLRVGDIVKLASNENPLGMSPLAREAALATIAEGTERYPDQFELIAKLAQRLQVDAAQIVLGNGSNDVLDLAARTFLAPGRSAVFSQYAFAVYPIATRSAGADCIVVPAVGYGHDLAAMQAAIVDHADDRTRLVWIANPNNPTGTLLAADALRRFIAAVPSHVAVVLDEAYNEYLPADALVDTLRWIDDFDNLVVTRTFSKIYGLAGLRVGYAVASKGVAGMMNRVRQPFNVGSVALAAAAAALDDTAFVEHSQMLNRVGMAEMTRAFAQLELNWIPSSGNFVCVEMPQGVDTAAVNMDLLRQGVIVRPVGGYGMPQHLRVSIGRPHENERFIHALGEAVRKASGRGTA